MEILITICARGGSKGIPGKNIKLLNGKPLIAYTIGHALEFIQHFPADIALSTDDEQIIKVAKDFGVATEYFRPADLATDIAGKIPVISDLLRYEEDLKTKKYDYVLDLDVSAPMRNINDLLDGFKILLADRDAYNLFSVSPAHKNPYFNMVERNEGGYFSVSKPLPSGVESRQQAPKVYEMNASFYFYTKAFFDEFLKGAITKRSLIYIMDHICFDLDVPVDFEFLEFLVVSGRIMF